MLMKMTTNDDYDNDFLSWGNAVK